MEFDYSKLLYFEFFNRDPQVVAKDLLGKIIYHLHKGKWLSARIIETESYYLKEKGSHSSLGYTHKRRALFMPAGTIYMYYARGKDSLNISCKGEGNAVLIKSAFPWMGKNSDPRNIEIMQKNNPMAQGGVRPVEKLCSGQTLLCSSLGLKVPHWDAKVFNPEKFYFADEALVVNKIIQTTRLGIPVGRDEHLMYRFVDYDFAKYATKNPLTPAGNTSFRIIK